MAFKYVVLSALLVAVANGGLVPVSYHAAPVALHTKLVEHEPYDPNPQYKFAYDVHDYHTGDIKSQHESRDGDVVHGSYSLSEPDGTRRIVDYTADPHNGFNAVVRREPAHVIAHHATPIIEHHQPLAYSTIHSYHRR